MPLSSKIIKPLGDGWCALAVAPCELRLKNTLENGQCFGWHRQPGDDNVWVGVLGQRLLALRETESGRKPDVAS